MSAVNVVAVLDALESQTRRNGGSPSCETIARASSAMAELLTEMEIFEWPLIPVTPDHPHSVTISIPVSLTRLIAIRAALSRCRGESA